MSANQPICLGFKAAGVAAGIKKNGKPDLGLIFSEVPAAAAGLFTRNRVQAAPVRYDRQRIQSGRCQAVIVNSGNANCSTGPAGERNAAAMAEAAADRLGIAADLVLVASTGVIGEPLPVEKIAAAAPELVQSLRPDGFAALAEAIMTTDTVPKLIAKEGRSGGRPFALVGTAKGAGMIHPDMATMLCFICTDAEMPADLLQRALARAVRHSFNRISIDGDTSTNDTVLLLANGMSGARITSRSDRMLFQSLLDELCLDLAKMLVKDGEGATKLIEVRVTGAVSARSAHRIANTIAGSSLVKTAFFGEDANWGRILGAAGRAQVSIEPDRIDVFFNDVQMVKAGVGCGKAMEAAATRVLKTDEFVVTIDLHMGAASASVYTCDFSLDYVRINADYRS